VTVVALQRAEILRPIRWIRANQAAVGDGSARQMGMGADDNIVLNIFQISTSISGCMQLRGNGDDIPKGMMIVWRRISARIYVWAV
jgi:hypothetical protein